MKKGPPANWRSFTLIELLVVISIIGILMGLLLVAFQGTRKTARDGKRKADLEQIRAALEMYRSDRGSYPIGSAGSDRSCWINNEGYSGCHPLGALKDAGYMAVVPVDPGVNGLVLGGYGTCGGGQWYLYSSDGRTYLLAAVEEIKGNSGCICNGIWAYYQCCLHNP